MKKNLLLISVFLLLTACASRPKLYPNEKYRNSGKEVANNDIERCMAEADEFLESSKGKKIARGAGAGATIGAAIGAVGGMFTGNMGRGLVRGGAMGAAGGGASGAISPDTLKKRYVNQCLGEQGYRVLGWD